MGKVGSSSLLTFIGVAVAGYTLYITMQQQSPPQQQPSPPIVKIAEVTPFDSENLIKC
jgi:hypothetical protein